MKMRLCRNGQRCTGAWDALQTVSAPAVRKTRKLLNNLRRCVKMRYIQKPVFKFEELSDSAKEHATSLLMDEHFWGSDSRASLRAFCKHFSVTLTGWNYSPFGYAEV